MIFFSFDDLEKQLNIFLIYYIEFTNQVVTYRLFDSDIKTLFNMDFHIVLNKIREKNRKLNPIIKSNTNVKSTKASKQITKTKNGKTEYYTIQLSSFEDRKAAEKLARKMTGLGYPSRVTEAWVKGKTWFRVQHGEYKMIAVAKQVSIKLKNKYKFNPWISNIYK